MQEVKVPKLGDNIEAADVVSVLVSIGESISQGQGLLELESDKASVEVPSPAAGVVKELRVSPGDRVQVDQVILILDAQDSASPEPAPAADTEAKTEPETQTKAQSDTQAAPSLPASAFEATQNAGGSAQTFEIRVPKLGDNISSAEITRLLVAVGDSLTEGQGLLELESDKASVEVPSPYAGVVESLAVAEGDKVSTDQLILVLKGAGGAQAAAKPAPAQAQPASQSHSEPPKALKAETQSAPEPASKPAASVIQPVAQPGEPAPAAPSVRRFARELGVDIHSVKGQGPGGRISKDDVKAHVKALMNSPKAAASVSALEIPDMPDFSRFGEVKSEKMSNVRRATAKQMSLSWSQIPHVTQFDQADISEVEVFRKAQGKKVEAAGGKLTVTAILLKLCALALKRFPQFNASIDLKNEQIIYKQYCHIGVAVDTPRGLVVPVIRDVDQKGLVKLAVELGEVGKKARDKKLSPDDMSGAGFTISNLGGLGTTYFTPIVNWPEVAILGVGRASLQPVWQDSQFVPRMIMPLSISYDHRLVDGADAARFLRFIAEALENPLSLLME